jgi:hypothetical protein
MGLSFQEKSLWAMLVGIVVVFGFYFSNALSTAALNLMPHHIVLFAVAVVLLVLTQIVGQALIAIVDRQTASDERDQWISLRGTRNGAYVLASGVFVALCMPLFFAGNFAFTHTLLAFWVLAQLVEIASQLWLYRRGV